MDTLPAFQSAFKRYGGEMYCIAPIPNDSSASRKVVAAFLDLYAFERGWQPLKGSEQEVTDFLGQLRSDLFRSPSSSDVHQLLLERRFVILQGPPGTGKTRLADEVRRSHYSGRGMTIQFHPSVSYEDFVVGLSPDPKHGQLRFGIRAGSLLVAAGQAEAGPFLLTIDEVNRADLGKVMGEAIYLFEAGEVGGDRARRIRLPHALNGEHNFHIPDTLYVLGTMNTADRSIASLDLAIRRRFAFVNVPPDRGVVASQGLESATRAFDRIADVFVEHASEEAFGLVPGHAYFLATNDEEFARRVRFEIIPLLDDYQRQGLLGAAGPELQAVRDSLEDDFAR
jgi:5-methylcytosine-specific restriction protein B